MDQNTIRDGRPGTRAERLAGEIRGEPAIQGLRRVAEHSGKRGHEVTVFAGGHPLPEMGETLVAGPCDKPFEKGRSGEIRHGATEILGTAVQLGVGRQPPLERELAQHSCSGHAIRPPATRDASFDVGRVSLDDPAGGISRDRTDVQREEAPDGALQWISRWAREVGDVRELVDREELRPIAGVPDLVARLRRSRPEHDRRLIEDREGRPVRHIVRIVDDHRHLARGSAAHQRDDGIAHRLEPARGVGGPGPHRVWEMDIEVCRVDGLPLQLGAREYLGAQGPGREGDQEADATRGGAAESHA